MKVQVSVESYSLVPGCVGMNAWLWLVFSVSLVVSDDRKSAFFHLLLRRRWGNFIFVRNDDSSFVTALPTQPNINIYPVTFYASNGTYTVGPVLAVLFHKTFEGLYVHGLATELVHVKTYKQKKRWKHHMFSLWPFVDTVKLSHRIGNKNLLYK